MTIDKVGAALRSLGPADAKEQLRAGPRTTAEPGLKGNRPWRRDPRVLDPDRHLGAEREERLRAISG